MAAFESDICDVRSAGSIAAGLAGSPGLFCGQCRLWRSLGLGTISRSTK
jgi:hypothetical protein